MNATVMAMLLIAVHVMICVLLCVLSRVGVLRVEGRLLPFMLLVPLWGPLCVLMLHTRTLIHAGEHTAPGLEQMRVDDEERRSILVEERADFANTVPLEEALIVNDSSQRRSLVMSILNDNPSRYIDVLSQARLNEDVEVVHYAATAMAQISAKEDLALQRCRNDYLQHRNSETMLERYCDALERYVNSGIAQGYALQLQKQRYAEVLQERLRKHDDYHVACRLAQMQIDLGLFDDAAHTIDDAMERWPDQGDVWLMRLRLDAARNDGDALRQTVQQIESKHIYLGGQGRRTLRFWTGAKEAERA